MRSREDVVVLRHSSPVEPLVYHFSEDPGLARFEPHVPRTNPQHPPAVWAIDEWHAPLYWFPRDCPRVTAWPRTANERTAFRVAFHTDAQRVHAIEMGWLAQVRVTTLYRYAFDPDAFAPWDDASGQWISRTVVEPIEVTPVGDLLDAHATAGIELRLCPTLWPIHDLALNGSWDFSIVRMRNAQPRT